LTICWSAISYGQECLSFTGPVTLPARIDTTFVIPVYNLDSFDLATNQRICKVNINFATEYPEDLQFSIVSPFGQEVILTGRVGIRSLSAVIFSNWDVSFVPLDSMAMPDLGYDEVWENGNTWFAFETYTGSYWPYEGADIDNIRTGNAYGEWKLRVVDALDLHAVTINSFSIEFCNPSGIDCNECLAASGTINPATLKFCENDPSKYIEFSDYLRDTAFIDNMSLDYKYNAVIVHNDTIIDYRSLTINDSLYFNGLQPGNYQVYGMAYDTLYKMDIPDADSTYTIDSLRSMIDSLPRIFCGALTTDALTIVIDPIDTTYLTETICNGDSLVVGDSIFRETIMTQVNLSNQFDCDSIIIVDLEVISIPLTVIDTILCHGDSLEFNGTWYTVAINQPFRLSSTTGGCDSTVLLDLRFHPYNFREVDKEICSGEVFPFFGNNLNMTGVYRDSLMDSNGCDSVVQLNLTVVTEFIVDTTTTLCIGDTFFIDSEKYFSTGMYSHTFPSTLGCDSTVNLDLTIVEPIENNISEIICFGDSLQVGNQYYKETGEYIDTLASSIGCDSIVMLELIVRPLNGSTTTTTICFGDSIQSAGKYYNADGIYIDTLQDRFMCDSIIVLELTIRPENRVAINDMICFGDSVIVGDSIYNRTGTFETVLSDVNNCDSIVVLDLIIMNQVVATLDSAICRGDSILVGDDYYNEAGNYEVLIERTGNCDSTVMLNLEILDPVIVDLPITLCSGTPYDFGGKTYTVEGIYRDTVQSVITGCDSIVILDLQYAPVYLKESFESKCSGDSSFFDNRWIKETGVYDDTLRTVANCDSIARLNLTFLSLDDPVMITETLCFGDSLLFDGGYLKENGIYRDTLVSSAFCDSLVILDLNFRVEQRFVESMTICLGDTVYFQESLFTETGEYPFIYSDVNGCDSTIILNLLVEECPLEVEMEVFPATCSGIADGSAVVKVDYGNPIYQYFLFEYMDDQAVESGELFEFGESLFIADLDTGRYSILIRYESVTGEDVSTFYDFEILESSNISLSNIELTNPTCDGRNDGSISFNLDGEDRPYEITWSDNVMADSVRQDLTADDYRVYISNNRGCRDSFDFTLIVPDPITFEIDQTLPSCAGLSDGALRFTNVSGGTGDYVYSIGLGEQASPAFSNLGSGTYSLSVEDENGCIAEDLEIIDDPAVFSINLGDDFTIDNLGDVELSISSNAPIQNISWSPIDNLSCTDCPNPIATITNTVTYRVTAESASGCTAEDNITVILDIDRTVDPAQAFTPNGDGVNDIFIVHGNNSIAEISNIEVYARSGELVWKQESFPVNDPNFGWDGTFQGEQMTSQILGYFLEVIYTDGKTKIFKGQLALIR